MTLFRIVLGVLLALLLLVVAVPGIVLVDLVSGGTGYGLCVDGLGTCTTGVFAGAELLAILSVAAAVVAALIAAAVRILRWLSDRKQSVSL